LNDQLPQAAFTWIDWLYPTLESKVVEVIHILPPRPISATAPCA